MVRKTKFWAIMFSVVFVIGLAAFLWLRSNGKAEGAVARIWLDGELYEEIELDAVVMPYEFDVTTELGTNRIRVEHGSIQVVSADCPDQVCVRQGAISGGYVAKACVPHGLVIDIVNPEGEA